jgi:hypothetical protein
MSSTHAHVVHHIPGRLRLKLPGAKGDPAFLDKVREALAPLEGVEEVIVNSVTGSVLVHYDADNFEDFHEDVHEHATRHKVFVVAPPKLEMDDTYDKLEREAEFIASRSHSARAIVDFLKNLDVQLKKASDNSVDLKVIVPLGLAVYSMFGIGLAAATPVWVTLGLFSFNHFLELHAPPATQAGDQEQKEEEGE